MEKVRIGIIGLGNMGTSYIELIFSRGLIKDGYITALCDINPEKIEAIKPRMGDDSIAYFEDYIEMLDSGLVDAVMVETPHYLHPEMVTAALERNIHVLCDKPAGVYQKQVREMNEAAERSSAVFGMMFNQRTNPIYRKMREMIAVGEIGKLQRLVWVITNWYRTQYYFDSGSWRATWRGEGGGVLINQCPHQIDLISWLVGKQPSSVSAFCHYGKWHDIEVEDDVTAYLEYDDGATGVFITSTGEAPGVNRLEISGTKGRLVADGERLTFYKNECDSLEYISASTETFGKPKCEVIDVECEGENPQHSGIINNFIAAILGREELFADGPSGILGVELMNAIELSGFRGGARVSLPPNEDEYLGLLEEKCKTGREKSGVDRPAHSTKSSY